jgi:uncharacterized protein involved in propanediol utilization
MEVNYFGALAMCRAFSLVLARNGVASAAADAETTAKATIAALRRHCAPDRLATGKLGIQLTATVTATAATTHNHRHTSATARPRQVPRHQGDCYV